MHSVNNTERENGGILGSNSEGTITHIITDKPNNENCCPCTYSPNTDYLNSCISEWSKQNIHFAGIFHTHIGDSKILSEGDSLYINDIMCNMPESIDKLYFPVISFPAKSICCYVAKRTKFEISIVSDELIII